MSDFHDEYPQYEIMAHHSEEEGVQKRKALWKVFFIMLAITIVELIIGFKAKSMGLVDQMGYSTVSLKFIFIILTIVKAAYIVMSFMHLGHENKLSKWVILAPYTVFIVYLVLMGTIGEGNYSKKHRMDMNEYIVKQNQEVRSGQAHHGTNEAGHGTGEEHKEDAPAKEEGHH